METVGIHHIQDKFPEKNGGLKDLFDKGPQDRFFLVKFWVSGKDHHSNKLNMHFINV